MPSPGNSSELNRNSNALDKGTQSSNWQVGDISDLMANPDVISSLTAYRAQFPSGLSKEELDQHNAPLVGNILAGATLLKIDAALREWDRFTDLMPLVGEAHDFFKINPHKLEKTVSPYCKVPTEFGPFRGVGLQLTWEAYVVETIGMALVHAGVKRDGGLLNQHHVEQMVSTALLGRANKPHHLMLNWAANATLNPDSNEALRLKPDIAIDSLYPLVVHGGPKTDLIWELSGASSYKMEGGYLTLANLCKLSAEIAEGPSLLEGYRIIQTPRDKVIYFEPWDNLQRNLCHTANAIVGTFKHNGEEGHGIFSPLDRQIVTNQAGLYNADRKGIALSGDKLIWGAELDALSNGSIFLIDHVTEVIWREGIVAIDLCSRINPKIMQDGANYSARNAEVAQEWLIDLIRWRLGGEGTWIIGKQEFTPEDFDISRY